MPEKSSGLMKGSERLQRFGRKADCLDGINPLFLNTIFTLITEFKEAAGRWGEESEKPVILAGVRSSFSRNSQLNK